MFDALYSLFMGNWIASVLGAVAVASTILTIIVILSENRNPVKSLAWVTVLLLLPVVGLILYLFFGRSFKNVRMISHRSRRKLRHREKNSHTDPNSLGLDSESIQQINLLRSLTGTPFYAPNTVEVLTNGRDKFDAFIADLRSAKNYINIQYYIFEDDKLGRQIADILIEKAREGVKVRLIYDHVGSFSVRSRFFKKLRKEGVQAYPFFRVTFPQLATRINWRNHRKQCVIDGTIGYVGGMNVADRYLDGGKKFAGWRDTHVRVTGDIVSAIDYSFAVDWNFMGGGLIEDAVAIPHTDVARAAVVSGVGAQYLTSGPMSQWPNIAYAFLKAISNAKKRVYIQTPYFLPTDALLRALQAAALSRVDVRIMMPRHSDSTMLSHASASYIGECLRSGIKIYLYTAGMLHSKMMIVDDEFVTIGSTNFDFRSFECNFEGNLFFYSKELTAQMLEVFKSDQEQCERVNATRWRHRPFMVKTAESVLRLLSPVL